MVALEKEKEFTIGVLMRGEQILLQLVQFLYQPPAEGLDGATGFKGIMTRAKKNLVRS